MKKYQIKRNVPNQHSQIVYYIKTDIDIPCSLGWDTNEILSFVKDGCGLSICIRKK